MLIMLWLYYFIVYAKLRISVMFYTQDMILCVKYIVMTPGGKAGKHPIIVLLCSSVQD